MARIATTEYVPVRMARAPIKGKIVQRKSTGKRLRRTTVYFPAPAWDRLRRYSEREGRQVSAIVVAAVGRYLDEIGE